MTICDFWLQFFYGFYVSGKFFDIIWKGVFHFEAILLWTGVFIPFIHNLLQDKIQTFRDSQPEIYLPAGRLSIIAMFCLLTRFLNFLTSMSVQPG